MGQIPEEPKQSGSDAVYALVRAAASAVPLVGGPAVELFGAIVAPPMERRRQRWFQQIADAIAELQATVANLTPEKLSQNDIFVTSLLHSTQIASRTHEEEKLEALRNALVNCGIPEAIESALQQIFLNHIDQLTTWHIRILRFFDDPPGRSRDRMRDVIPVQMMSPAQALERGLPELAGRQDFYRQILEDLQQRSLLIRFEVTGMSTGDGALSPRTTTVGKQFLTFISRAAGPPLPK